MKIFYRPEIDGLRAISVFAVILYHAHFNLFDHHFLQGGFIGVDIFFVISGYLITTLILNEIYLTSKFSLVQFYERRIRRIIPTLLIVMIISSVVGFFFLLHDSFIDLAKSNLSSIFFISNFYFQETQNSYGAQNGLLKPLLHTWSLSVEEQFYILFPIFLSVILRYFKKYLLEFLCLSLFVSLLFAQYCSKISISFNFYLLPSRGFELLIGSVLAYLKLNKISTKKMFGTSYSILNKVCPGFGITLIIYSFLFFNFNKIFHPGFITLLPIIGVGLIIWFAKKGELITEIISSKILIFFGLISYSLYLWHYPIFAYLRYLYLFDSNIIKILSILFTIILSLSTFFLIEKPFRNKNIISCKTLIICILSAITILVASDFYILEKKGLKNRFANIIHNTNRSYINFSAPNLKKKSGNIALIGDSHAQMLSEGLNKKLENKYSLVELSTYLYVNDFKKVHRKKGTLIQQENDDFIKDNKKIENFIENNKNLIVILTQSWSFKILESFKDGSPTTEYLEPINVKTSSEKERQEYLANGLKITINNILKQGHAVILIYQTPELNFDAQRLINRNLLFSFKNNNTIPILTLNYDDYIKRNKLIFEILDSIKGPKVYRVYPDKYFCNTVILNKCVVNNKKHLFYYDDNHLSLEGSKYVVNDIIGIIKKIEIKKN
jgi:peptidoglycan/LPS O-acetylase OafA/YrhL